MQDQQRAVALGARDDIHLDVVRVSLMFEGKASAAVGLRDTRSSAVMYKDSKGQFGWWGHDLLDSLASLGHYNVTRSSGF